MGAQIFCTIDFKFKLVPAVIIWINGRPTKNWKHYMDVLKAKSDISLKINQIPVLWLDRTRPLPTFLWTFSSPLSRCTHCTVPPVLALRRLSRSSQPESCLTRPFKLQPPTQQLMLHPMLLVGPSNLIHKLKHIHDAHVSIHTHIQDGDAHLWPWSNWFYLWIDACILNSKITDKGPELSIFT